jgi:hypothetical protein
MQVIAQPVASAGMVDEYQIIISRYRIGIHSCCSPPECAKHYNQQKYKHQNCSKSNPICAFFSHLISPVSKIPLVLYQNILRYFYYLQISLPINSIITLLISCIGR